MTPKPKKNTRKEIRGWAVVAKEDGNIAMWNDSFSDFYPLAIFRRRGEVPRNDKQSEKFDVKRCRIILD